MQCLTSPSAFLLVVPTVTCSGGHSFCFGCGQDKGHAPVICKVAEAWVSSRDSGTTEWLNVRRILTAYFLSAYTRYRLTHANAPNALITSRSPVVASKNTPIFFSRPFNRDLPLVQSHGLPSLQIPILLGMPTRLGCARLQSKCVQLLCGAKALRRDGPSQGKSETMDVLL